MIKNIVLLILLFTASSCLAQENLKDYYYSIGTKKEVSVYKYIDKNNLKNIEYWKVTTNPATNTILTESYTTDFRLYNIFEETITSKGAEIIRYVDFMKKNNGKIERIEGTILSKDVYKWSDSTKYTYAVKYKRPIYGNEVFTKDRTKNSFTDVNIYGKKYATVKFLDEYEIELQDRDQIYKFYILCERNWNGKI